MHLYLHFHQKAVQNIQVNSTLMSRIMPFLELNTSLMRRKLNNVNLKWLLGIKVAKNNNKGILMFRKKSENKIITLCL
jgi:hypothetical protein